MSEPATEHVVVGTLNEVPPEPVKRPKKKSSAKPRKRKATKKK